MNKTELLEDISNRSGFKKTEVAKMFDAFLVSVGDALEEGENVRIVGFGTFSVSRRKATDGRNPKTGEPIKIAASNIPKFKPGKGLKESVNKK